MTSVKPSVSVTHERLADVQVDGSQFVFLRHYVHSGKNGRVLGTIDTDLNGVAYELTGIRVAVSTYDVFAGVLCVTDPGDPGNPFRVKQFLSTTGQISYTTIEGFAILELPVGAVITECGD